jgi:hypothetical protein
MAVTVNPYIKPWRVSMSDGREPHARSFEGVSNDLHFVIS